MRSRLQEVRVPTTSSVFALSATKRRGCLSGIASQLNFRRAVSRESLALRVLLKVHSSIAIFKMINNCYESLKNDKDESSGDDESLKIRRKEKGSLRIRLKRVFSAGSPMSPGSSSSRTNSLNSSPAHSSNNSPSTKFRYSWQTPGFAGKLDNRSPQQSPQQSPRSGKPQTPGTPRKLFGTLPVDSTSSPASPARFSDNPKNLQMTIWYGDQRMKYSPQQQQKERKSESESMNATPSRDLDNRTRSSTAGDAGHEDSAGGSTSSRFSICRRGSSTEIFAWMRVFRLATMLHQVGC